MAKKNKKERMMVKHRQMRRIKHRRNLGDMDTGDKAMMVRGY
jgi:hypothetical protein